MLEPEDPLEGSSTMHSPSNNTYLPVFIGSLPSYEEEPITTQPSSSTEARVVVRCQPCSSNNTRLRVRRSSGTALDRAHDLRAIRMYQERYGKSKPEEGIYTLMYKESIYPVQYFPSSSSSSSQQPEQGCMQRFLPVGTEACLGSAVGSFSSAMAVGFLNGFIGNSVQVATGAAIGCGAGCAYGTCLGAAVILARGIKKNANRETPIQTPEPNSIQLNPLYYRLPSEEEITTEEEITIEETIVFLPECGPKAQVSSLIALQTTIGNASEQVLYNLKKLALKTKQNIPTHQHALIQPKAPKVLSRNKHTFLSLKKAAPRIQSTQPYTFFGFADSYELNLERKVRSGRTGSIIELYPDITLGLAYYHCNDETSKFLGIPIDTALGIITSKMKTNGFACALSFNSKQKGFTGHLVASHSWGKIKVARTFMHGKHTSLTTAKGSPDIRLNGGLIQLGYNIPIFGQYTIIPYIESAVSSVHWNVYKERSGFEACRISQNTDLRLEYRAGLLNQYDLQNNTCIKFWVAAIWGLQKTGSLNSKPLMDIFLWKQASVPYNKQSYSTTELGLNYEAAFSDTLSLGITSTVYLNKDINKHSTSLYVQYTY